MRVQPWLEESGLTLIRGWARAGVSPRTIAGRMGVGLRTLERWRRKYPALALETQNGNIAGFVVDQAVGEALVATSDGKLEVSNFEFTAEEASFGKAAVLAKGTEDLMAVVNEVVDKVTADGSYQQAYDEAVALAASLGL